MARVAAVGLMLEFLLVVACCLSLANETLFAPPVFIFYALDHPHELPVLVFILATVAIIRQRTILSIATFAGATAALFVLPRALAVFSQ